MATSPLRILVITAASVCAALIFRDYLAERIYVATASMESTMPVQSRWWVDKITLKLWGPSKGEVVVLVSPVDPNKELIKRVIAVEGDTIEIKNKTVFVNGQEIKENYIQHTRGEELLIGDNLGPLEVPEDAVFLMGDNRDESGDSRDWRDPKTRERIYFVSISKLKGRILGVKSR